MNRKSGIALRAQVDAIREEHAVVVAKRAKFRRATPMTPEQVQAAIDAHLRSNEVTRCPAAVVPATGIPVAATAAYRGPIPD